MAVTRHALVVVESPAKVKTIQKYLAKGFVVKASLGHLRDLPSSKLGVDVQKNFAPQYVPVRSKAKTLEELKKAAKKATELFVATDPDREGEAIGWHVAQELRIPKQQVYRVLFNEITERAVKAARVAGRRDDAIEVRTAQPRVSERGIGCLQHELERRVVGAADVVRLAHPDDRGIARK